MNLKLNRLIKNSSILSIPGILSVFFSLISIPIHLKISGVESYGNYIVFHFLLIISLILNFGIGKSITVSINNVPKKNKEIGYQGLKYTIVIILFLIITFYLLAFLKELFFIKNLIPYEIINLVAFGVIISVLYASLEGILQGNQKFKSLSICNFIFFSLSISLPSISLIFFKNFLLNDLVLFSLIIKFLTIFIMLIIIYKENLVLRGKNRVLFINLRNNSRWLTLNNLLIQFYDLSDKYLVKIFLGPIAIATYSIPQQLTGKLSIFSKGFSAFLLPNLSKKNQDIKSFNFTLKIFLIIIPIIIFFTFPLFDLFLNYWLKNNYNKEILILTKVFSLCSIFSCASHLLITKFEATKTLNRNLKIEITLIPFFLGYLYFLTSNSFSLIYVSILILFKEWILLIIRLNLLKKSIYNLKIYYLFSTLLIVSLYFSIYFEKIFVIFPIVLLTIYFFNNDN